MFSHIRSQIQSTGKRDALVQFVLGGIQKSIPYMIINRPRQDTVGLFFCVGVKTINRRKGPKIAILVYRRLKVKLSVNTRNLIYTFPASSPSISQGNIRNGIRKPIIIGFVIVF